MSLFYNKTLRDSNKNFLAFIWWMKNLSRMFCVHSQCRSKTFFWVNLDGKYVFAPTPNVGAAGICGVYVILILWVWQISHKGQQSLTKLNAKAGNIYVEVFLA